MIVVRVLMLGPRAVVAVGCVVVIVLSYPLLKLLGRWDEP